MPDGPLQAYRALIETGEVHPDAAQFAVVDRLEALSETLSQAGNGNGGVLKALFASRRVAPAPKGVYLFGAVGRGKSMLMDLFYETAPVPSKRRVHFHAFMQEVHRLIHRERNRGHHNQDSDVIKAVAKGVARESSLLCFDELHVTDIADAMILGRLFKKLFERDIVMVATSNRPPTDLYKGGINRELFAPFIDMIEERLDVVHLEAEQDYRLAFLQQADVYCTPLGAEARRALDDAFEHLVGGEPPSPLDLEVQGRMLHVPCQARHVARFSFQELCDRPLGAADYLVLTDHFHTLVIDDIPRMDAARRNEATRFVTLIDVLYDNRVNLICSADAPPEELYIHGDGAFEFQRTASRLIEMRSDHYLALQRPQAA
jgi:cell division protein ZapE